MYPVHSGGEGRINVKLISHPFITMDKYTEGWIKINTTYTSRPIFW
jgi:hypothetical protein